MKLRLPLILFICLSFQAVSQKYSVLLGRPTDKTMTFSVLFDQNIEYYLEYGTQSGNYATKSIVYTENANVPQELDIEGLIKNCLLYTSPSPRD